MLVISEYWPKNMISNIWAKKLLNSGMMHFKGQPIRLEKVILLCFYSKPLLNTSFGG